MPRRVSPPRPGRPAEIAALASGLLTSALLLAVAVALWDAPERLGRGALSELGLRLEERAADVWEELLEPPEEGPGVFRVERGRRPPVPPAPVAPGPARETSEIAFDALLREAERRRWAEADPSAARSTLTAALRLEVDAARRARGRLLQIRLARARDDAELGRDAWWALRNEASGAEVDDDGDSLLLLAGLALAPLLEEEERADLQAELVELWRAGALAWAPPLVRVEAGESVRARLAPRLEPVMRELHGLAAPSARLTADLDARRALALAEHFGAAGEPPADGLEVHAASGALLLRWGHADGWLARVHRPEELVRRFEARWAERGSSPDELRVVHLAPGEEPETEPLRPPWAVPGLPLRVGLVHDDVTGFVAREARGLRALRAAVLVLAVLTLALGLALFAALRRRRRLQELKELFVANVSHELRTPVTGLRLTAESLAEGRARTPARRERYHGILVREARRLERLVADVLDFARLERGEGARIERRPTELEALARVLREDAESEAAAAGMRFECELGPFPDAPVELDAEALRRATANLVRNACLHSRSDCVKLEVRAERGLLVRVLDRGRGIARGEERRIFEPFHQASLDGTKAKGTGLGLAIAREIAEAHRGSLELGPGLGGRGAGFELRVPVGSEAP